MPRVLPANEITALLGRGTTFDGKLHFTGRVRIDGGFRGEIRSEGTLVVGEGAEIDAEIHAETVIIKGGRGSGNVHATRSIELYVPCIVTGNLQAPEVFMDKGVHFSGNCRMAPLTAESLPSTTAGPEGSPGPQRSGGREDSAGGSDSGSAC